MLAKNENLGLFLQARMGSTRLPGKVLMEIGGKSVLALMVERIRQTEYGDRLFVLTSDRAIDDVIAQYAATVDLPCFRGNEKDVLDRFIRAARHWGVEHIVRLTADSPFLSLRALTDTVEGYFRHRAPDYYFIEGYPVGIGSVEAMSRDALSRARRETATDQEYFREHVMTYLTAHPEWFRVVIEPAPKRYQNQPWRLALDEKKDLQLMRLVFDKLGGNLDLDRIFELFRREPKLAEINKKVVQKS